MREFMVTAGKFFFKWRNLLFPLLVIAIFSIAPPATTFFGSARLETMADATAITIVALGVLIRLLVIGFFDVVRDGDKKTAHADELFTRGMFGISRNSLYLGNLTIYTGVFMLHGTPLAFGLGLGLFLFIYHSIIASEEAFLSAKFGKAFSDYLATVPRLLPKLSNWGAATKGMSFSWKRAIYGEYNIIGQAILMVALALWYEQASISGTLAMPIEVGVLLTAGVVFVLVIRTVKRR